MPRARTLSLRPMYILTIGKPRLWSSRKACLVILKARPNQLLVLDCTCRVSPPNKPLPRSGQTVSKNARNKLINLTISSLASRVLVKKETTRFHRKWRASLLQMWAISSCKECLETTTCPLQRLADISKAKVRPFQMAVCKLSPLRTRVRPPRKTNTWSR